MRNRILEAVKGSAEPIGLSGLQRVLGVATPDERREFVRELGALLFPREASEVHWDARVSGYREGAMA